MNFYSFARIVLTPLLHIFYPIKVTGRENIPKEGGLIVCANHISLLDPFFIAVRCKRQLAFMAKEELFRKPVLKTLIKWLNGFPVNRKRADVTAIKTAISIVSDDKLLLMFPEGTRSKTGEIASFKTGAALITVKSRADILPVAIRTKKNKVRLFRKIRVSFGEVIKNPLALEENSGKARLSGAETEAFMEKIHGSVQRMYDEI